MSRLEALDIQAGYADTTILKSVDLAIPDGQVTILVGPNGCGKSTLSAISRRDFDAFAD